MTTHRGRAKRRERGWELHIDGVGMTQARRLNETEEKAHEAEPARRKAGRVQNEAAAKARRTVAQLRKNGLNNREIARYLHISPQRVSRLTARVIDTRRERDTTAR